MKTAMTLFAAMMVTTAAQADLVQVEVTGSVEYNQINFGSFANVNAGDPATLSFQVDSDVYLNGTLYPTRGYEIIPSSFSLTLGTASVGLLDPYQPGELPYFVVRDNDPAVDGFLLASHPDVAWPDGVVLSEAGNLDPHLRHRYSTTYTGDTLSSLDILDAVGTYDYTGLTVFGWAVVDGPFDPIYLDFEQMTISVVPAPASLALLAPLGLLRRRRRA